jgi:hypothetical protein
VLLSARFVAMLAQQVATKDKVDAFCFVRWHPQQRVPVRRSVMVRFCDPESVEHHGEPLELRADSRPHALQPLACVAHT